MKKRLLTVAGATVLALSMSVSALAADVVTEDKDYGTAGNAVENKTGWGSNLNGQFAIEDNQKITFTFDSQSADTSNAVFGWVAEITDNASYFTITQGATCWFAPDGSPWKTGYDAGDNGWDIQKSWADDEANAYAEAMADAKVTLDVTRSGNQIIFESKATGSDGKEYTQTIKGIFKEAPTGTLYLQVGCDHGSMTLYSAKYSEAGKVEQATVKEKVTLKPNMDANKGVAGSNDSTSESNDSDSSTTVIVVVVAVVLVVAVVAGVLVATKKKNN